MLSTALARKIGSLLLGVFCMFQVPVVSAAYNYGTGGMGTVVIAGGNQIYIVVRMEFWGDGAWNDPSLVAKWEKGVEAIWTGGDSQFQKYKCFDVQVDMVTLVSPETREGPEAQYGTAGYHQIWVPDVATGDMANSFSEYGLYLNDTKAQTGYSYGSYDETLAAQYYQENAPGAVQEKGKGQVRGFVQGYQDIGSDAQAPAIWGTIPNTASLSVVAHEMGHLMGINHDGGSCEDNLMAPSSGKKGRERTEVYPRYFRRMLDDIGFTCEWTVRTDVNMTTPQLYFPAGMKGHAEVTLKEEVVPLRYVAKSEGPVELIYDYIEPQFTCNTFTWKEHAGKIQYEAEIFYNFKEDLKTGGRMVLTSQLVQNPMEEITQIAGCGSGTFAYTMEHRNFQYALDGTNLQVTPYNHENEQEVSCPAKSEENITEKIYTEGVVINGAQEGAKAEHFPQADLFTALFDYTVQVIEAEPSENSASGAK